MKLLLLQYIGLHIFRIILFINTLYRLKIEISRIKMNEVELLPQDILLSHEKSDI